ncbi:unnamed protein product [Caenorhabditis nigoni]
MLFFIFLTILFCFQIGSYAEFCLYTDYLYMPQESKPMDPTESNVEIKDTLGYDNQHDVSLLCRYWKPFNRCNTFQKLGEVCKPIMRSKLDSRKPTKERSRRYQRRRGAEDINEGEDPTIPTKERN